MKPCSSNIGSLGFAAFALTLLLAACDKLEPKGDYVVRVEIAPNEWLGVERLGGRAWLKIPWKGKTVFWPGDLRQGRLGPFDIELALCLRSWKDKLYLISESNDPKRERPRFNYWTIDASRTRFEKISPADFPRQIATENLQMETRFEAPGFDRWEVNRKLDYQNPWFDRTKTAAFWMALEGTDIAELNHSAEQIAKGVGTTVRHNDVLKFYEEYIKKYHPIALPTIIDEHVYEKVK